MQDFVGFPHQAPKYYHITIEILNHKKHYISKTNNIKLITHNGALRGGRVIKRRTRDNLQQRK